LPFFSSRDRACREPVSREVAANHLSIRRLGKLDGYSRRTEMAASRLRSARTVPVIDWTGEGLND